MIRIDVSFPLTVLVGYSYAVCECDDIEWDIGSGCFKGFRWFTGVGEGSQTYVENAIRRSNSFREIASSVLMDDLGFYLVINHNDDILIVSNEFNVAHRFSCLPQPMRKYLLFLAALESYAGSGPDDADQRPLFLLDPDSGIDPRCARYLGEAIAEIPDKGGHVVVSVTTPYMMEAILEKAPRDKLAVYLMWRDPISSLMVKRLGQKSLARVYDDSVGFMFNPFEYVDTE